ncbi:hypothetical protein CLCR_09224 [Cladophialophora carrionii]|uniref:Uncharacterized protein n=1 Tax=Cladophialophora carrionii TaxID=86049 RepID=A0A1C1CRI8_9EURO|nr:hypothetical protein CLCR_09224 [Cladophialophora carrionii]
MSAQGNSNRPDAAEEELDDWDQRIFSTGCAGKLEITVRSRLRDVTLTNGTEEQLRMNDCYYDKKDWRACKAEVGVESPTPNALSKASPRLIGWSSAEQNSGHTDFSRQMEAFRQCWKRKGNEERTQSRDASSQK